MTVAKMLFKILFIFELINIFLELSESIQIAELNDTRRFLANSKNFNDFRADVDLTRKSDVHFRSYPRNCAEATAITKTSGIYEILIPSYSKQPFKVTCDAKTQGGGWTVILSRLDGSVNFYRNWNSYKKGFGDLDGEFFLGLDKIHALTSEFSQKLQVVLEDFEGIQNFETYDKFAIGDEEDLYALDTLGKSDGTAGDSLRTHHTMKFSTFDRDNDRHESNCAELFTGAWWYNACHHSNLAGKYNDTSRGKGINWYHFRVHTYSLKRAIMMIRPRK